MGVGGITLGIVADRTSLRTVFPIIAVFGFGALWALWRMDGGRSSGSVDPTTEELEATVPAATV